MNEQKRIGNATDGDGLGERIATGPPICSERICGGQLPAPLDPTKISSQERRDLWDELPESEQESLRRYTYLRQEELEAMLNGLLHLTVRCPLCNSQFSLSEQVLGVGQKLCLRSMPCDYCRADYIVAQTTE